MERFADLVSDRLLDGVHEPFTVAIPDEYALWHAYCVPLAERVSNRHAECDPESLCHPLTLCDSEPDNDAVSVIDALSNAERDSLSDAARAGAL